MFKKIEQYKQKKEFERRSNKKYKCVFVVKERSIYSILKIKEMNPVSDTIRFQANNFTFKKLEKVPPKTFLINVEEPTFELNNVNYYFMTVNGTQMSFESYIEQKMEGKIADLVVAQHLTADLTANPTKEKNKLYVMAFVALFFSIFGGLIGFIIKGLV